jgi:hypothetical protein
MRYFIPQPINNTLNNQKVLSRKPPYHQYTEESEIRSALYRGEAVKRPTATDDSIDEINDQFWDLIMRCCVPGPEGRLTLLDVQMQLEKMEIQNDHPKATSLPGVEALAQRSPPDINWDSVKRLLDQIQVCQVIMGEQPLNEGLASG